jgi:hypothetical protein
MNKKNKIIIITTSILAVAIFIAATVLILRALNGQSASPSVTNHDIIQQASSYEAQADNSSKSGDTESARALYEKAKQIYSENQETDKVPSIDGKLYVLDHPEALVAPQDTSKSLIDGGSSGQ